MLLWLLATALLAVSPLLYFVAGAADDATESARSGLAAIPILAAAPLLALAIGLARRRQGRTIVLPATGGALLLVAFAGVILLVGRHLGSVVAIRGDVAWTLFWASATILWVALSAALLGRRSPSSSPGAPAGKGA